VCTAARPNKLVVALLICHTIVSDGIRAIPERLAVPRCNATENVQLLHHVITKPREPRFLAEEPIIRAIISPARGL